MKRVFFVLTAVYTFMTFIGVIYAHVNKRLVNLVYAVVSMA